MKIDETITDTTIVLSTQNCVCELSYFPRDLDGLVMAKDRKIFLFDTLKAKVEGQGDGTFLLRRLCEIADEKRIIIVNPVNPFGNMSYENLVKWYRKFGFKRLRSNIMVRYPWVQL